MARGIQTAGGSSDTRTAMYAQRFADHSGALAMRVGTCQVANEQTPAPPEDFSKNPVFCFQVYTSAPIDIAADPAERQKPHLDGDANIILEQWDATMQLLGAQRLYESEAPTPIWEIYTLQDQDTLAFIDHSRHEIAHRKALRDTGDASAPLIPKLVLGESDERKMAFLFSVHPVPASESGDGNSTPSKYAQWVHFDPRLPSTATTLDHLLRLEDAPGTLGLEEEDIRVWPEQVDTLAKRIRDVESASFSLVTMLDLSCSNEAYREEDASLGMDFSLMGDEPVPSPADDAGLRNAAAELDLETTARILRDDDESVTITNTPNSSEPDLQYVIYAPFLHSPSVSSTLEDVAKAFFAAFQTHLPADLAEKTLRFTFYKPQSPSDGTILAEYRALQPASIGFLTTSRGGADTRPLSTPRRLIPISINPHMTANDPETCGYPPYQTFVIILDRTDFHSAVGGVRLLLADRGVVSGDAASGYLDMEVWRSENMQSVARRLTMMPFPES